MSASAAAAAAAAASPAVQQAYERELPFYKQVLAGAFAGLCEVLTTYPLDVVKTRFHLNTASARNPSVVGTLVGIVRKEGFWRLYRGIASPLLAEAPKRATKFASNEQYRALLKRDDGRFAVLRAGIAGSLSGTTEAFVNCPFEVVKVRMQAVSNLGLYANTWQCAAALVRTEGVLGLFRGLESMVWRAGVWNGLYFGFIEQIRRLMPRQETRAGQLQTSFISGVIAGTLATTIASPTDIAKSRIQNSLPTDAVQHRWTIPTLVHVYRHEGWRALYKGYVPMLLRLGPGGGVMLLAFDLAKSLM